MIEAGGMARVESGAVAAHGRREEPGVAVEMTRPRGKLVDENLIEAFTAAT